jgi:hypothetical protein
VTTYRHKGKRAQPFVVVDAEPVRALRLSMGARGLHEWMLDKPDDWEFSAERIAAEPTVSDGRDRIRSQLRQLELAGLVRWRTFRDDQGHFVRVLDVRESTAVRWPDQGKEDKGPGGAGTGKAVSGATSTNGAEGLVGPGPGKPSPVRPGETGQKPWSDRDRVARRRESRSISKYRDTKDLATEHRGSEAAPFPSEPPAALAAGNDRLSSRDAVAADGDGETFVEPDAAEKERVHALLAAIREGRTEGDDDA